MVGIRASQHHPAMASVVFREILRTQQLSRSSGTCRFQRRDALHGLPVDAYDGSLHAF